MLMPIDEDSLYEALLARDRAYDGLAYVGVTTTGIFCRLTCPARKPQRRHSRFFPTTDAAEAAGFRPCLRCRPLARSHAMSEICRELSERIAADPEARWTDKTLVGLGFDPSTVRRAFKRNFGLTFARYAREQRLGRALATLEKGGAVVDAQLDAGYASSSGFRDAVTRLIGEAPVRAKGRSLLTAGWLETPLGAMLGVVDAAGVHLLEFADRRALPRELERLTRRVSPVGFGAHPMLEQVGDWLAGYFAGHAPALPPLVLAGTPFQQEVWRLLGDIPAGRTRSYGDLARALGKPAAFRAVALANGANQLALLIPCHRVIGSDGAMVGYGGGLWRKKWLIGHEHRNAPAGEGLLPLG